MYYLEIHTLIWLDAHNNQGQNQAFLIAIATALA